MIVYVAVHGEQHEGSRVVSVHAKKEDAVKAAKKSRCCFAGGWQREEGENNYWTNGCDFISVEEHEVKE